MNDDSAGRPVTTHLFDENGRMTTPGTIQRGDRIEIRGEDGRSTIVKVDDIDDGPGGSFAFTVTEVPHEFDTSRFDADHGEHPTATSRAEGCSCDACTKFPPDFH